MSEDNWNGGVGFIEGRKEFVATSEGSKPMTDKTTEQIEQRCKNKTEEHLGCDYPDCRCLGVELSVVVDNTDKGESNNE